ncbi:MAG: shikimate kinase [Planctomycetota bacterium]
MAGGPAAGGPIQAVALVGPRAAGKSAVGRALARELGWEFVDADAALAAAAGAEHAGQVLQQRGEPAFRALEEQVTAPLLERSGAVVALGGGAVLSAVLRRALQRPALLVALLLAEPAVLAARIGRSKTARPPLTDLPLEREVDLLLAQRLPHYRAVADLELDSGRGTPASLARQLAARVRGGAGG